MASSPPKPDESTPAPLLIAESADATETDDAINDGNDINADSSPDLPPLATHASAAVAAAAAAAAAATTKASSGRRLPPPCWTHEETLALIDAYRDKWLALKRGNLRAADWDAVAAAVTARCNRFPTATPKTGVQCRHKVEKLRKRYRAEKLRSVSGGRASSPWPFFPLLHDLAIVANPNPSHKNSSPSPSVSRRDPPSPLPSSPVSSPSPDATTNRRRSIHNLVSNGAAGSALRFTIPKASRSKVPATPRFAKAVSPPLPMPMPSFNKVEVKENKRVKRGEEEEEEGDAFVDVAAAIRAIGDGYLRMEERKMEMAREMEKARMEAELRRTEMILDSQRIVVETFVKGFLGKNKSKRAKISMEN